MSDTNNSNIKAAYQDKVNNLSMLEQNLQQMLVQRQNFQTQIIEIESAISEMKNTDIQYKIVGSIMIKSDKESLQSELSKKKEILELRISTIKKQEDKIREKAKSLQQDIMSDVEKEGN